MYTGKVVRIMNFGAFVELLPGKDGMIHISKLANHRVDKVEDVVKIGDTLEVKVAEIDAQGATTSPTTTRRRLLRVVRKGSARFLRAGMGGTKSVSDE